MLAYNTTVGFVTEVITDRAKAPTKNAAKTKKTRLFAQLRAKTLRFLHVNVPGVVANDSGRTVLRLPESRARQADWQTFQTRIESLQQKDAA